MLQALRESIEVRIEFPYLQQHIKWSQCLSHRKSLTGEDLGRKKRSGVLLNYLFGKKNLHQPLHKWHRRQSCEGHKIQNELPGDMG